MHKRLDSHYKYKTTTRVKPLLIVSLCCTFLPWVISTLGFIPFTRETVAFNMPFGICNTDDKTNTLSIQTKCTPCPVTTQGQILLQVQPQYAQYHWKKVQYNPVPGFWINTHDPVTQDIYISGRIHNGNTPWDSFIWDLIVRVSKENADDGGFTGLIVDVGANIGYFSLQALALGHKVIAFEPMNRNMAKILTSVMLNNFTNSVSLYHNAVSSKSGDVVSLQATNNRNQGNGQVQSVQPSAYTVRTGVYGQDYVETVALSDIVNEYVLLMKIDVEGMESSVIDGSKTLLCNQVVKYIVMEFSTVTRKNSKCPILKMLQTMQSLGYTVSDVTENAPTLQIENYISFPPNILFTLSAPADANVCK